MPLFTKHQKQVSPTQSLEDVTRLLGRLDSSNNIIAMRITSLTQQISNLLKQQNKTDAIPLVKEKKLHLQSLEEISDIRLSLISLQEHLESIVQQQQIHSAMDLANEVMKQQLNQLDPDQIVSLSDALEQADKLNGLLLRGFGTTPTMTDEEAMDELNRLSTK
ncbi:hypothetical protein BLNAU_1680 [Blattamonas nauphoetae]|uniref:Uncharacterized protein n=1 Tax=Blattamonas nauphoetae TaxID=2049346 RepID=A0ABQ9YHC7_9EUKA|nr:hypothetical protein BLNAU_1680 [Blattamonas nauphoetae]